MPDALRLAIGTLCRIPVPAPRGIDARTAGRAMLLAPLVGAALALVVGTAVQVGAVATAPAMSPLLWAALGVGALAFLTRGMHLDGLADTADALGSARPSDEALAIARRSDIGPFGVMSLVLLLLVQVAAYSGLVAAGSAALGLVAAVGTGRLAATLACVQGIPAARRDGLGATFAGSVAPWAFALAAVAWTALCATAASLGGRQAAISPWSATVAILVGLVFGALAVRVGVRRLGGITGDVLGATIEITTGVVLVILVAIAP
jgi:adenosylcobinamide-GDP ribazoletransferase